MTIHTTIKKYRDALGWSQQQLAAEVSRLEGLVKPLTWQTVQQWENGKSAPKRARLEHVAEALGVPLNELLGISVVRKEFADDDISELIQRRAVGLLGETQLKGLEAAKAASNELVHLQLDYAMMAVGVLKALKYLQAADYERAEEALHYLREAAMKAANSPAVNEAIGPALTRVLLSPEVAAMLPADYNVLTDPRAAHLGGLAGMASTPAKPPTTSPTKRNMFRNTNAAKAAAKERGNKS